MVPNIPSKSEKRELFYVEKLAHLLFYRTLDEMLPEALSFLVNSFRAAGGTIFYVSLSSKSIRQGELVDVAQEQIGRWKKMFSERARTYDWRRQFPQLAPVSRHLLPDQKGTLFNIPLISHDRLLGFTSLFFPTVHKLDHLEERSLSQVVYSICAIATTIEQIVVTRQRLSQLGLFYQMAQVMTATFDLNRFLRDTIQLALAVIDAQCAVVMLLDQKRQELVYETLSRDSPQPRHVSLDRGVAGWVVRHGRPVLLNDVTQDAYFDPEVDGCADCTTTSLICVPMQVRGKVIGVLEVLNKAPQFEFDYEDLSVLLALSTQAAIALDNARLYNSQRIEYDYIIKAQKDARHELARSLHDGPIQLLAALSMGLDHLERLLELKPEAAFAELKALRKLTKQAMQEARMVLFKLRPIILETQGLAPALQSYVKRLETGSRFAPHFDSGNFESRLDGYVEGTIFSIVQEAVSNVERHAQARNVWIRLQEQEGDLVVSVEDDGKGFDVRCVQADYDQLNSFGILNMHERAELIEGVLTIDSGPGRGKPGTLVQLRITLPKAKEL